MKLIKFEKTVVLEKINEVQINNELMGTKLVQSKDDAIHINAELYLKTSTDSDEINVDDFINVSSDEKKGTINIEIEELDLNEDDYDLSDRSELTISIPAQVNISIETENFYIYASGMNNNFVVKDENGPVKIDDCNGEFKITNENGPIRLYKLIGDLVIEEENGPVSADSLSGNKLDIASENGPVKIRGSQFKEVIIRNENGVVYYESMQVDKGSIEIENENGHITLSLSPMQGFSLEANAELGQIKNSFMGENKMAFDKYTLEIGDSALKVKLTTENGMIKLISSDMISGDYLKKKLEYVKELLKDNSENGINEAHKIIGQLIGSLNRLLESVNEDVIKEKIEQALEHLKSWKSKINDPDIKNIVNDSIESVSQEVNKAVQEAMKIAHEAIHAAHEKYKDDYKYHFDTHYAKGKDFIKHFKHFKMPPMPPFPPSEPRHRADAMHDAARIKILEMLEAGKITSEEAEKLLKAIH